MTVQSFGKGLQKTLLKEVFAKYKNVSKLYW